MLLNHRHVVSVLAAAVAMLVFVAFRKDDDSDAKKAMGTLLKVFVVNFAAVSCLFLAFGEERMEVYSGPMM